MKKPKNRQKRDYGGRGGRGNFHHNHNETDPSLLFPEFVPVPPSQEEGLGVGQQSMLLLVGLPGSGKSTFGRIVEKCLPWKYARVNQDELSSRQKCINRARSILNQGKCPIVDRCNFDVQQRSHFLQLAAESTTSATVPVDCVVLKIDTQTCLARCRSRRGHPTLPPSKAGFVIHGMAKDWKAPSLEEGFRSIFVVENNTMFRQVLAQFVPVTATAREGREAESAQETQQEQESDGTKDEQESTQNESSSEK